MSPLSLFLKAFDPIVEFPTKKAAEVYAANTIRFLVYFLEAAPILATRRILGAAGKQQNERSKIHRQYLIKELRVLLKEDATNIENGVYPIELLKFEPLRPHVIRYGQLYLDSIRSSIRKRMKKSKEFSANAQKRLENLPDYYARNFHFQTDGYLSDTSAELYAHQTEILFLGTLNLMRRLLLAYSIQNFKSQKRLRILELGSGTGELTHILATSLPQAEFTCVDLSEDYINKARARLRFHSKIKYAVSDATQFKSKSKFDWVISSYCLHELPIEVRKEFVKNASQLVRPNGYLQMIDSLQLGERPEFDWALKQFPKDFHEPFYKNYIENPMELLFTDPFEIKKSENRFLSKSVTAVRRK